jgi:hypothetical protein
MYDVTLSREQLRFFLRQNRELRYTCAVQRPNFDQRVIMCGNVWKSPQREKHVIFSVRKTGIYILKCVVTKYALINGSLAHEVSLFSSVIRVM